MGDDKPVIGYSMTGVPITESRWHLPKQPWWIWTLIVLGVLAIIGSVVPKSQSASDKFIHAHYAEWRAECVARATDEVDASDGLYTVGGNHWVGLVNSCITAKADDQVPTP